MKKFLCILLAILLVFALAGAAGYGLAWYQTHHVFIENKAYPIDATSLDLRDEDISIEHYEALTAALPRCEVTWSVPFQNGKFSNDSESLSVTSLTAEDVELLLTYFPKLKSLDATGCEDYAVLTSFMEQKPECAVTYQVALGGKTAAYDTTELVLENGEYAYDTLMENLQYLPGLTSVTLRMPELSLEQVDALAAAYENVVFSCTAELLGTEYDTETTAIDLSMLTSGDVPEVAEKLAMLPKLETVELMAADGTSQLNKADVKALQDVAPDVTFHYSFDFFGTTISTADEEVVLKNVNIGDENEAEVRAALDIMENCSRFVLDSCKLSNEVLAQLREDYRGKANVVWRITFGKNGSCLTDHEVIMCSGTLEDSNCGNLKYCEGARFVDLGHNDYLTTVEFVAGMPNLEAIIVSGSSISDLSPFANCKKLRFLELAFCGYVKDLTPLASCESLEMLNIGYTKVTDLAALDNLNMTLLSAKSASAKIPDAEQKRFAQVHPDCWAEYVGKQPYGIGWRYAENNQDYLPYYAMLRVIFKYPAPSSGVTVGPNKTGWYLSDCDLSEWDLTETEEETEIAVETEVENETETVNENE